MIPLGLSELDREWIESLSEVSFQLNGSREIPILLNGGDIDRRGTIAAYSGFIIQAFGNVYPGKEEALRTFYRNFGNGVTCPTCGSLSGKPCIQTRDGKPIPNLIHQERIEAADGGSRKHK